MITIKSSGFINDFTSNLPIARQAFIFITDGIKAYSLGVGGLPLTGDLQTILNAQESELWLIAVEKNNIINLPAELRKINAAGIAKSIPNWATWTQAQADAWYQTNIRDPFTAATTLAAMKLVIGTMINVLWAVIQMVLALRDENWPDLPDRITIK